MHIDTTSLEQTIPTVFARQVRRNGTRTAIVTEQGQATYEELDHFSDRIAAALVEQGVQRGQTVGILIEQGIEQIAAILGTLKAGAIYVPLDVALGRMRLREILNDADPRHLLTDTLNGALARLLGGPGRRSIDVQRELPDTLAHREATAGAPDDFAYIYYTSGTTGLAKGVVDNHRNVLHNIARYTAALKVDCNDRLTLLQSCGFSGAVSNVFTALLNGATLLPFDVRTRGPGALARWLAEREPTIYHSVPSLFRQLTDCGLALPSLRIVRLEGDLARPVDVETFNRHFDARCTLVNGLGATETGISAQYFLAHGTQPIGGTVPVGKPTADMRIDVVNPLGQPAAPGELGEIVVSSKYLACGYWRRPDLTDAAFSSSAEGVRSYRTRDLGRFDSSGRLELLGRVDLRAKLHGEWVDLGALERALTACPGVHDAIVETRTDSNGKPLLVAWVQSDGARLTPAALRDALAAQGIPARAWPSRFVQIDRWPLDRNGKIDRKKLAAEGDHTASARPPEGPTEVLVAEMFRRRLGLRAVNATADFFELGGDSLQAVEICLDIERATGNPLALSLFQHAPSVAGLARALDDAVAPECIVPLQPHGSGAPMFCVHAHMGHVFNLRELAMQFAPERPFFAIQARDLNGTLPLETDLGSMADDYVDQLLAHQPNGPYLIGGYCFGAWVAIEMARRLRQRSVDVLALLLIDPELPRGMAPRRHRPAGAAGGLLRAEPASQTGGQNVGAAFRAIAGRVRREVRGYLLDVAAHTLPSGSALRRRLLQDREDANTVMSRGYRPSPYDGEASLFIAANKSLAPGEREAWERYIRGGVQFHALAGPSRDLLRQPYVRDLAASLQLQIEAADQTA